MNITKMIPWKWGFDNMENMKYEKCKEMVENAMKKCNMTIDYDISILIYSIFGNDLHIEMTENELIEMFLLEM